METTQELRKKLQTDVLGHKYLQRSISIYLTRILLLTKISANQVTMLVLVSGVLGAVAVLFGWLWLGLVLFYLNILFDAVDGEIARYRNVFSLRGVYLDIINHLAIPGLFFLALTFWVADVLNNPDTLVLVAGVLGAFALPLLIANGNIHKELYVRPYAFQPEKYPHIHARARYEGNPAPKSLGIRGRIAGGLYALHLFAFMLIVVFLAALAEAFMFPGVNGHPILSWVVVLYAALFWLYLARRIYESFFSIEDQIGDIAHLLNATKGKDR